MDLREGRAASDSSRLQAMSDDMFLLAESNHRVANELAAALAALRLVKAAKGSKSRWHLLGAAIDRLEAFAVTHKYFAAPLRDGSQVDVGAGLALLCSALSVARRSTGGSTMSLSLPSMFVDGIVARSLCLIADELVTNSIKYALEGRSGLLRVSLGADATWLHLVVADDGPGITPDATHGCGGLGAGIVAELVRRARGELSVTTGSTGTTVRVSVPHSSDADG